MHRDDTVTSPETATSARHVVSSSHNCVGALDSLVSQRPSELTDAVKTR